jgi:HlyD family secretion protein
MVILFCVGMGIWIIKILNKEEKQSEYSIYLVKKAEPIMFRGSVNSKAIDEYYIEQSNGTLETIHVENGQVVQAGDVLMTYQNGEMNQQVQTQEFSVRQGELDLNNAESDLAMAYVKKVKLQEKKGELQAKINETKDEVEKADWSSQLETITEQITTSEDAIIQAERAVVTAQLQLEQAQSNKQQSEDQIVNQITARQSGIAVVDRNNQTSSEQPIIKIVNQEVFIEGQVTEFDYEKLQIGQTVDLKTLDLNQKTTGTITAISPLPLTNGNEGGSTSTTTYLFSVKPDMQIQYGFNVQISLPQTEIDIPKKSVVSKANGTYVYLYENGKVTEKAIQAEKKESTFKVLEGVSEGQKIIMDPDQSLKDHQKVVIRND